MNLYPRTSALRSAWLAGATSLVLFCGTYNSAWAQPSAAPKETETAAIENSKLNAEWMLLILLGEMQVTQGNPGAGYSMILKLLAKVAMKRFTSVRWKWPWQPALAPRR